MPAEIPGNHVIQIDPQEFAAILANQLRQSLQPLLLTLIERATNVRTIAADSFHPLTVLAPSPTAAEVISASLDRSDLFVLNSSDTTVSIGSRREMTTLGVDRFDLPPGVGVNIGARCAVWAVCAVPGKTLSVMSLQWNPEVALIAAAPGPVL